MQQKNNYHTMDIVNSVTQNSNNTNEAMENQGGMVRSNGYSEAMSMAGPDHESSSSSSNSDKSPESIELRMSEPEAAEPAPATTTTIGFDSEQQQEQQKHQEPNNQHQQQQMAAQFQTSQQATITTIGSDVPKSAGQRTGGGAGNSGSGGGSGGNAKMPDYLKAIGMDPSKFWPVKYRFTREKPPGQYNPLTIAQRNFYEHNGYLVIDNCVTPKLLDNIRTQYKQSQFVDEYLLDKLLAKNNRLLAYVKCFCDERLMLMTHQLVETFQSNDTAKAIMDNKQAQQRQQLFRDWIYLPFRPIDKVVCAITAIEELNHVILVVPGTHKIGQCSISSTLETISAAYETSSESSQKSMARELFECAPENLSTLVEKSKKGFRYINLKPGQTIFYHPGLIHGFSDDLINYRKRQLASIAYYAAADCEYVDLRKSSSPEATLDHPDYPIPISLAHFKNQNPTDYSSWIGRPRLLTSNYNKANL